MSKGYVENEFDNINIVNIINFSVSENNQKNSRSSSKRFIREEDQCGGKKTGGALDLLSYNLQLATHHFSRKCRTGRTCSFGHLLLRDKTLKTNYKLCQFQRFPILKRDVVVNVVAESPEQLEMKKIYSSDVGIMI